MDITGFSNKEFLLLASTMWRVENSRCFDGTLLRVPYFGLYYNHGPIGEFMGCHYENENAKRDTIILNRVYLKNLCMFQKVLIHEMIHQEQAQQERKRHHDKFFTRRCIEILAITNLWVK